MGKSIVQFFIVILIIGIIGEGVIYVWKGIGNYFFEKKYDCANVDDCISQYKFIEARKYASKNEDEKTSSLEKIISSETEYWISQNELEKAKNVAREMLVLEKTKEFSELYYRIIKKYCSQDNFEEAELLAHELPENLISVEMIRISGDGNVEKCRNKYNRYKKSLNKNQEIELFKESEWEDYRVSTNHNLQAEALELIAKQKKIKGKRV